MFTASTRFWGTTNQVVCAEYPLVAGSPTLFMRVRSSVYSRWLGRPLGTVAAWPARNGHRKRRATNNVTRRHVGVQKKGRLTGCGHSARVDLPQWRQQWSRRRGWRERKDGGLDGFRREGEPGAGEGDGIGGGEEVGGKHRGRFHLHCSPEVGGGRFWKSASGSGERGNILPSLVNGEEL